MNAEPPSKVFAAVDLGAGSGRVIAGILRGDHLDTVEVHRFANTPVHTGGVLCWDVDELFAQTMIGLRQVRQLAEHPGTEFAGIGVDSWGVDYGLLRDGVPVTHDVRHHRAAGDPAAFIRDRAADPDEVYAQTGILDQPINTVFQLARRVIDGSLTSGAVPLFIPDLWTYLLSGDVGAELTMASTGQLVDVASPRWSRSQTAPLRARGLTLPELRGPGTRAGVTTPEVTEQLGASAPVPVYRVGGHDTASAFAFASPVRAGDRTEGLVSSGTWSLAGLAVAEAHVDTRAREAGFTTERGVRGFLMMRNLSGMWLVQECLRSWGAAGVDFGELVDEAEGAPSHPQVFDVGDVRLLAPQDMPATIARLAAEAGRQVPTNRAETLRAIFDSLAEAYHVSIVTAAEQVGVEITAIRIVGGGSRNRLICQATADRSGLPVLAGPAEASGDGNLAVQLHASGAAASLAEAYRMINGAGQERVRYVPGGPPEQEFS